MTHYSRQEIIDIMHKDFQGLVPKETIEESLIKFNFIAIASKEWLKEHCIEKQLSAKEIADLLSVSVGHVQKTISKYNLTKRKHGITTGNNRAWRRAKWKQNLAKSQPHAKAVKVYKVGQENHIFVMNSISSAAKKLNLAREHVRDCLSSKKPRRTAGGYRFEYVTEIPKGGTRDCIRDIAENFHLEVQREKELKQIQYR
jgi:hypothetical protein